MKLEPNDSFYYSQQANEEAFAERCQEEVEEWSDKEIVGYIHNYSRLNDEVWNLLRFTWRGFEPRNEIDSLLKDVCRVETYLDFIAHFGLMEQVREMVTTHYLEKEMGDR